MAFGTLAEMMINVGANLSPLGKGLQQAKGQLASFNVIGNQTAASLSNAFGGAALKIGLVTGAIYGMQQAFSGAIAAADEYRLGIINIASTLYDMLDKPKRDQQDFNDLLGYASEMYKVLELEAVKHFSSGKDLQLAWMILTQKGVALRFDEVNALGMVVDKIKLITQGQMSSIQITQEIRSMINGQARVTDQLAILLEGRYGKAWKGIVAEQRKSGNLIKWLAQEMEGLARAQEYIYATIEAQSTTLWTMVRRIGREGLSGAYDYIANTLRTINEYLIKHEQIISQGIQKGWGSLEPTITAIGLAIQRMAIYIYGCGDAFITVSGYILFFTEAVIRAGEAFFGFIEAHAWIIKLMIAFWALNAAVGIIASISMAITKLVLIIINAGVAIGTFVTAGAGLSIVASGFIGIGIAVTGLVALIFGGISAINSFADAAVNAIKRARDAASFATGITQEEYREKLRVKSYRERAASFEQVFAASVDKPLERKLTPEERRAVMKPGAAIEGALPTEKGGTAVKKGTKMWDDLLASGKTFAAYDEKNVLRVFNPESMTTKESYEYGKLMLEGKEFKAAVRGTEDKGGKGGAKAPAKLSEWPAIKAERDKELEFEKNRLNEIEKNAEAEIAINDNKYAQGILSGTQYAQALLDLNEKVYQGKLVIINKEREIEKEAYAFRKANIELEVARGALSPDKALIEQRKALAEYQKQNIKLDKDFFDAGKEKTKELIKLTTDLIAARKTLVDLSASMFQKITGGPLTEERKQLLAVRLEFAELAKQIDALKFSTTGKLEIDPALEKSANAMIEAGKLLNADWAEPLAQAVRELAAARTGAEASVAQQKIREIIPQVQKTVEFDIKYKAQIDAYVSSISNGISSIVDALTSGGDDIRTAIKTAINNMFKAILKDSMTSSMNSMKESLTTGFRKLFGFGEKAGAKKVEVNPLEIAKATGVATGVVVGEAVAPHLMSLQSIDRNTAQIAAKAGTGAGGMEGIAGTDYTQMSDEDFFASMGESPFFGEGGSAGFADELIDMGADSGMSFGELAKLGMEDGAQSSGGIFNDIFGGIFKSLSSLFGGGKGGEGSGGGGAFANALMGVIGMVGMIFSSAKGGSSFTPSGIQPNVTSTEPVRGIVAGPTSIPIAQISVSIREAFAASENYLSEIASNTRNIGNIGGGGGGSGNYAPTYNISVDLASIKAIITDAMDTYFKNYLMVETGRA